MQPVFVGRPLAGLALGCLAMMISWPAGANETPEQWLVEMSRAAHTSNYQGVMVYRGEEVLETFRVTHRFENGSERERVQSMTGEVREVLKQNDKVTCLLPKDQSLTVRRASTPQRLFKPLSAVRLRQIASSYEIRELGVERIAGRPCRGIAISPRDNFRYGYELWADVQTQVPLKISLVSPQGGLIEQMFFTEVGFPKSIPDAAFVANTVEARSREASAVAAQAIEKAHHDEPVLAGTDASPEEVSEHHRSFSELPPGYQLVRRKVRASESGVREHLLLSDGLGAVSVYRWSPASKDALSEAEQTAGYRMGPVNAYVRVIGDTQFTVVGEAPRRTVEMIGNSIREGLPSSAGPGVSETVSEPVPVIGGSAEPAY